jgi:hypothetical protein
VSEARSVPISSDVPRALSPVPHSDGLPAAATDPVSAAAAAAAATGRVSAVAVADAAATAEADVPATGAAVAAVAAVVEVEVEVDAAADRGLPHHRASGHCIVWCKTGHRAPARGGRQADRPPKSWSGSNGAGNPGEVMRSGSHHPVVRADACSIMESDLERSTSNANAP